MNEQKELKNLKRFAKKIFDSKTLRKFKKIEENKEKLEVIKYLIKSHLDLRCHKLKEKIKKMKKRKKDVFFAEVRTNLLGSKIKLFNATFHKKDFKNVLNLFKGAERELENV